MEIGIFGNSIVQKSCQCLWIFTLIFLTISLALKFYVGTSTFSIIFGKFLCLSPSISPSIHLPLKGEFFSIIILFGLFPPLTFSSHGSIPTKNRWVLEVVTSGRALSCRLYCVSQGPYALYINIFQFIVLLFCRPSIRTESFLKKTILLISGLFLLF